MAVSALARASQQEVLDLHVFIEAWLLGSTPRSPAAFARFADVLHPDFVMIDIRGASRSRDELVTAFESAHGQNRGGIEVEIDGLDCRLERADLCLVTYLEAQRIDEITTTRRSTALFVPQPDCPNGVAWLHLHETWIPDE